MKKFLLVSPINSLGGGSSFPPLGLATIASYIPEEEYEVKIIDEGRDGLIDVNNLSADIVGISANTLTAQRAYKISIDCRIREIPTILGGIHPTVMPEEAANYATSVVIGNGEPAMAEIIADFKKGNLKKFYRPEAFDISRANIPRRDLLNGKYSTGNIQTSVGCPFSCKFCSVHKVHGKIYRPKDLAVVDRDLRFLNKKTVLLVDDNFFGVSPKDEARAFKLLELLKRYNIKWIGQASINIANNANALKLCRESGCVALYVGFESLVEDFLRSVKKSINLKQVSGSYSEIGRVYKEVIRKIHDNGICVLASFIYGTDFDTAYGLKILRDFIEDSGVDTAYVKPLTPFPGTGAYEELKDRLFRKDYWMETPYPVFSFKPAKLTMDELINASIDFVNLYTLPKSMLQFGESWRSTGNLWGATVSFLSNYGDYRGYKSFYNKNEEWLRLKGRW